MTIKELICTLNAFCKENKIYDVYDIVMDNSDILNGIKIEYITSVDRDEHRWYILAKCVYKVSISGKIYYIGTWQVESIKNEYMSSSDCECIIDFFEMEQYKTISYREKDNNNE